MSTATSYRQRMLRIVVSLATLFVVPATGMRGGEDTAVEFENLQQRPTIESLRLLSTSARAGLEQSVLSFKIPLRSKRAPIWALAYLSSSGTDKIGPTNVLTSLFDVDRLPKEQLSFEEEAVLFDAILVIGFVARKHDEAFDFLRRHATPEAWRQTRKWKSPRESQVDYMLLAFTIQALGISDRRDLQVDSLLAHLKEFTKKITARSLAGDIVQAEFFRYVSRETGRQGLLEYCLMEDRVSIFRKWAEGEGRDSYQWAAAQSRHNQK